MKILQRELRRLRAANSGDKIAIARVLDHAFGRRGKLRHQLTSRLISHPSAITPARTIPNNPRSSPPSYSAPLSALLTSQHGRVTGKALPKDALIKPSNLPARADPSSDEARLLGKFSLRREVNIRWRFFTEEVKRQVQPPLVVRTTKIAKHGDNLEDVDRPLLMQRSGKGSIGLEKMFAELERIAATPDIGHVPSTTSLQPHSLESGVCGSALSSQSPTQALGPFPRTSMKRSLSCKTRYFRRQFTELLSRTPILVETPSSDQLSVTVSSQAKPKKRLPITRIGDIAWIESANQSVNKRVGRKWST
ncbi:hypothetical protein FRB93_010159 [Tulasnella sp. JGI-2019a]|nr:hypothetical protein FRB93_010159 [Tulasnella sp. JGI-2019a]